MMRANRGEWSEVYAFLKILAEREVPAADETLAPIAGRGFVFEQLLRRDGSPAPRSYDLREPGRVVILDRSGDPIRVIPASEIAPKTRRIFERISAAGRGSIAMPEEAGFFERLMIFTMKAGSASKADLEGVICDRVTDQSTLLGFSIKSMVGGAATLLNASRATNFVFRVEGLADDAALIEAVNAIDTKSKVQDRIRRIEELGGRLVFDRMANATFRANLQMIDSRAPEIVAAMLRAFFRSEGRTLPELTAVLAADERLRDAIDLTEAAYAHKLKDLLIAATLGMVPTRPWDGFTRAHGGYLVVKANGDLVCYHLYNRDLFQTYLFENTKLESASTTRHAYGALHRDHGGLAFTLNLQVRFL